MEETEELCGVEVVVRGSISLGSSSLSFSSVEAVVAKGIDGGTTTTGGVNGSLSSGCGCTPPGIGTFMNN
jgi:hypothetical protein